MIERRTRGGTSEGKKIFKKDGVSLFCRYLVINIFDLIMARDKKIRGFCCC